MSDDLVRRLRGERMHFLADIDIRLEAADRIEALEAEAEKWKQAFTVQSNKLQSVLHIEGVRAALQETDT